MATITGQKIAERAWLTAQDTLGVQGVKWPEAEVLLWINNAQREIVSILPKAYVKRQICLLQSGTRQDFAGLSLADGVQLIDVPRNYASNGTTPGRAMTNRERVWFDEQKPAWHSDTAAECVHWMSDERDPKAFYIWPAVIGGGRIEVVFSASPPDLTLLTNIISIDDIYANVIESYVLMKFYSKDAVYTKNPALSQQYQAIFLGQLGLRDKNVMANKGSQSAKADGG